MQAPCRTASRSSARSGSTSPGSRRSRSPMRPSPASANERTEASAFPPQATDLLRHFPPALSARLAFDIATSPFRHPRADTFAEVVRASLGLTMTERFYAPYVEKLFGVPATALAGELARRRVGARSATALVRRVVKPDPRRDRNREVPDPLRCGAGPVEPGLLGRRRELLQARGRRPLLHQPPGQDQPDEAGVDVGGHLELEDREAIRQQLLRKHHAQVRARRYIRDSSSKPGFDS